jgi:hypothetical protein
MSDINNLRGGKMYFGSWFQSTMRRRVWHSRVSSLIVARKQKCYAGSFFLLPLSLIWAPIPMEWCHHLSSLVNLLRKHPHR